MKVLYLKVKGYISCYSFMHWQFFTSPLLITPLTCQMYCMIYAIVWYPLKIDNTSIWKLYKIFLYNEFVEMIENLMMNCLELNNNPDINPPIWNYFYSKMLLLLKKSKPKEASLIIHPAALETEHNQDEIRKYTKKRILESQLKLKQIYEWGQM